MRLCDEHVLEEATVYEFDVEDDGEEGIFPIAFFEFHMNLDEVTTMQEQDPDWKETGELNLKRSDAARLREDCRSRLSDGSRLRR